MNNQFLLITLLGMIYVPPPSIFADDTEISNHCECTCVQDGQCSYPFGSPTNPEVQNGKNGNNGLNGQDGEHGEHGKNGGHGGNGGDCGWISGD